MDGFAGQGAPGVPEGPEAVQAARRSGRSPWPVALPGDGTVSRLITALARTCTRGWRRGCTIRNTASRLREVILSLYSAFETLPECCSGAPSIR